MGHSWAIQIGLGVTHLVTSEVKEVAASPAGVGAGDRGLHLASPGRRGPQGRWRPRSICLASPDPSYSDASPSLALPCSHRDLRRGQGAPLRVPKSRGRGRTACCGPVRRGRHRWGARRRRQGRCSSLDTPRAGCGEVEERKRESGAGRAASGGWELGMQRPQGCACRGHRCILQQALRLPLELLQCGPRLQNACSTSWSIPWRQSKSSR
jgi:hypothetical protein